MTTVPTTSDRIAMAVDRFVTARSERAVALRLLNGGDAGISFARNATREQPGASLLKLALATSLYDTAVQGQLSLDEKVPRSQLGTTIYPSVLGAFRPSHEFSLREISSLMLITSDNPLAEYLVERIGLETVNQALRRVGFENSRAEIGFADDMLGIEGRANTTSAADALNLIVRVATDSRYQEIADALANNLRNTRIPLRLPDGLRVVHKTGTLEGVVNDAAVIYGHQHELAIAFLCDGEADNAQTSIAIGECVAEIWVALGESLDEDPRPAGSTARRDKKNR